MAFKKFQFTLNFESKKYILFSVTDTKISIDYRTIEEVLAENMNKRNVRFVFPSSVALETWSDWAVKNTQTHAVALQNWLAWDDFKQRFAQVQKSSQNCIPETLRKLFVRNLITECEKENFLFPLIPAAKNGEPHLHFTSWLASLLPSLKRWYEKSVQASGGTAENFEPADAEDKAFYELYTRYTRYLEKNRLFDPAWVESQQITNQFKFIIFHPEQLKDFGDFKDCILQSESTLVCLPPLAGTENFLQEQKIEIGEDRIEKNTQADATAKIECVLYPNARKELRRTVLKIRELNKKGTNWNDIALTVSNLEKLRPYVERELKNYCVPFVIRSGGSLTQNCAGRIFEEIAACAESKFNFESLSAILQDGFVPYRFLTLNNEIVRIALESRSLCEYSKNGKKTDPLEEVLQNRSFGQPQTEGTDFEAENAESADFEILFKSINETEGLSAEQKIARQALVYYKTLKQKIYAIYKAKTFKEIKSAWLAFEEQFLHSKDWPNDKDHIVGICISTLAEFIEIEETYLGENNKMNVPRPFDFFLEEIEEKRYMPQNSKTQSISVFDYRAAADCNFEYHFVINANQKALTVPFSELAFLNEKKRQQLGAANNDSASVTYIRLYAKAGKNRTFFSCSTSGFEGFCISHTFFEEYNMAKHGDKETYLDETDFFLNEKRFFMEENSSLPLLFTDGQMVAMEKWQTRQEKTPVNQAFANRHLIEKAKNSLHYGEFLQANSKKLGKITQTDLSQFFPCPRNWVFKKVLNLKEESQTAQIMQHYDFGTICHKIVENIFDECGVLNFEKMKACIHSATLKALTEKNEWTKADDIKNSALATQMLLAQKGVFENYIEKFLEQICTAPETDKNGKPKSKGYFGNYKVLATEKSFSLPLNENYSLYGQIDAILSGDAEQGDVIVDYKTGSLPDFKNCVPDEKNNLNDFQMATYAKLLLENGNGEKSAYDLQNALFYSLRRKSDEFKISYVVDANAKEEAGKDIESFEKITIGLLNQYLDIFMQKVDAGDFEPQFRFDPKNSNSQKTLVRPFVNCTGCKYKELCRTAFATAGCDLN